MTEEIKALAKVIRKQVKDIIEFGDIEDMRNVARYLCNISVKEAQDSIEAVEAVIEEA